MTKPSERSGNWGSPTLPPNVAKMMAEQNPSWDWSQTGEWLVARLYDDGKESERVACKIVETRDVYDKTE